jgi:hypothetical protein
VDCLKHCGLTFSRLPQPKNIMLVEGDKSEPFRIIDFGSAVEKGRNPFMDDSTEIYAPPEAPNPDRGNPEGYDVYALGITALRVLMPSMIAGESGIQCLGVVTTKELPDFDYDLRRWCEARAADNASRFQFKPLNAECRGLLRHPDLLSLIADMLSKDPRYAPPLSIVLRPDACSSARPAGSVHRRLRPCSAWDRSGARGWRRSKPGAWRAASAGPAGSPSTATILAVSGTPVGCTIIRNALPRVKLSGRAPCFPTFPCGRQDFGAGNFSKLSDHGWIKDIISRYSDGGEKLRVSQERFNLL